MSESALRLLVRVVKRRLDAGETLVDILNSYPKLTNKDKSYIKNNI